MLFYAHKQLRFSPYSESISQSRSKFMWEGTKNEPIREEQNSFHCGFAVLTAVCSFSPRLKPTAPLWVKNVPPQDEPIGTHSCSHTLIAVWPDTITHERERDTEGVKGRNTPPPPPHSEAMCRRCSETAVLFRKFGDWVSISILIGSDVPHANGYIYAIYNCYLKKWLAFLK